MKTTKKRFLAIICALVLVMSLALTACNSDTGGDGNNGNNSDNGSNSNNGNGSSDNNGSGDSGASIWEGVSFQLDMQAHQSSTEQLTSSYDQMIQLVSDVTGGAVEITAYEANSLYSMPDCLSAVSSGELIMCEAAEGTWYDNIPVTLLGAGLPFIYNSYEQAYMFMVNRGFVDILNEAYAEQNIHMIPYECYTASIISKSPITSVSDMQGMKLRASGSMALYEDLVGAAVTNVSGGELYSALSTGIVDGASWGSAQAMLQMNLQEVATYYMDPDPVVGQWNCIYFNLDWWNALTVDQQNMLEAAIQIAGYNRTLATAANNVTAKEVFVDKYGVTIQTLSTEAIAEFSEYGMQLVETFAQNDSYSEKAVDLLKSFLAEYEDGSMVYNDQISLNNLAAGNIWDGVSFNIDMQAHQSSTEQLTSSYDQMIQLVNDVTGGAVNITAYEANSLYSMPDCLSAVSSGELIMCEAAEGTWYDNIPVTLLGAGLPFVYSSYEQAYMFMVNRGFVDILNEAYAEHNIHMIPYECYTASIISKSPITSVSDMQGMKLRASGSMALFEDLVGAAVTNVSGGELYSALSTGIVDGASWGSAQAMMQMNLQEVATYYMDPDPVFGQWNCIYFNLDWWNALTVDQQNMLEAAIQMAGYSRTAATAANNVTAKEVFVDKYGVTIQTLAPGAISEFAEYGLQLVDTFAENDEYSAKAVDTLKSFLAEYEGGNMVYNDQISMN